MKTTLVTTAAKLCSVQRMRVYGSVFLTASLLLAWSTAKAASPFDTPPPAEPASPFGQASPFAQASPFGQPSPFVQSAPFTPEAPNPPASSKPAAPANYVAGAPSYTAKKSITLDGLMKEVYPNSPLHATILNKALVSANPKLLNGKTNQSIQRNATLNIPNQTQLIVQALSPYAPPLPPPPPAPPVAFAPPPPPAEVNQYGSQSSDPSSRRLWIRFP
jgi:hypothetical protein